MKVFSGRTIEARISWAGCGGRRKCATARTAAATVASAASAQAIRSRLLRRAETFVGTPACEPSAIHLSSLATSRALCQRSSGSFERHVPDDPVERGRRHRLDPRDRRGLLFHDRRDERGLARARERLAPRDHLVEHGAEREDVRARVGFLALELLGRHVLEGPEDRAGLREVRGAGHGRQRRQAGLLRHGRHRLGEAEVEQLHARLRDHDVAGLQIPVHDPLPVRLVERVGDLDAVAQRLIERQRALAEPVAERLALEVLHDEVLGLALAADVVERADVRMRELRDGLRLALEALARFGRRGHVRRQDLDGDRPLEPRVLRLVNLPHPARADRRDDLVGTEAGTRCEAHEILARILSSASHSPVYDSPPKGERR